MSRKARSNTYISDLKITYYDYERLLIWGQSLNEINFICLGKGKTINEVIRLPNTSRYPWKEASYNEQVEREIINQKMKDGLKVLAMGHSHPRRSNDQHPSKPDIEAISRGKIELIVFPPINKVRAWKIGRNLKETLKSEIKLLII